MAQAVVHTAFQFGSLFQLNNINPLQGFGSQLLPHNVWLNPAYWPFAVLDNGLALDISGLVSLGCLALACYIMARCFDLPVLPSIIAAQLSIILFAPVFAVATERFNPAERDADFALLVERLGAFKGRREFFNVRVEPTLD